MPRQYIIENGAQNNRWLYRVDHIGRKETGDTTCYYRASIVDALVFKKAEAVAFAKKWKARVWQIKAGKPDKLVWPE